VGGLLLVLVFDPEQRPTRTTCARSPSALLVK
jgi:hypothetical protein